MVKRMKHLIALTLALAACTSSSTASRTDPAISRIVEAQTDTIVAARTADIAARREQMLAYLHEYQVAGQFPTDASGRSRSVFRDDKGVRCPMAELIYRSGRADLVDAVVAEQNDLRLADVHTGPLADWMATSGLTRDEIIMVQGIARPWEVQGIEFVPQQAAHNSRVAIATLMQAELASERVRGRLETAEAALRKDSTASVRALALAPTPAATPGPVVPKTVAAQ